MRLAIVGAGLVGQRHMEAAAACEGVTLCAIADPSEAARRTAPAGSAARAALDDILAIDRPDAIVLATPNALHTTQALDTIAAGIPTLIEKPIASTLAEGRRVVSAAEAARVPLLVGHHRRHNPLIAQAKAAIDAGRLGRVTAAQTTFWLHKPGDYFSAAWRREPGGGPVMINLIHEVDLMRHFVGNVTEVFALTSSAARGFAVEDGAAVVLRFENGALGTLNASDTTSAPWSWEFTAGENPAYPRTDEAAILIGGTAGSLAIPQNQVWRHPGEASWWAPIAADALPAPAAVDPLVRQLENLRDVVRGIAAPLVSGADGLAALAIVEAILRSAREGRPVRPEA